MPKCQTILHEQHKNVLLHKTFVDVIHPTLHAVFTNKLWEGKCDTQTIKNYFFTKIQGLSNNVFKKDFNKGQLKKIDINPQCHEFDISLYFSSILLSAECNSKLKSNPRLVKKLQDYLRPVKDIRNNICHDLLIVPEA
ncbi:unnamed protein product, partial [Meganyctiphanes norvegica]